MKQAAGRYEPYSYFQLMEVSLRELLVEKGVVSEDALAGAHRSPSSRSSSIAPASFQSRRSSERPSRRLAPSARSPSRSDPKPIRCRETTSLPTLAIIRRTWRLRPSLIVISS